MTQVAHISHCALWIQMYAKAQPQIKRKALRVAERLSEPHLKRSEYEEAAETLEELLFGRECEE